MTTEAADLDHLRSLHSALDELLAQFLVDWWAHPIKEVKGPSNTTVMELVEWNYARICRAEESAHVGGEAKGT